MSPSEHSSKRASYQSRPEQVFFEDPALDRMMGVLLSLATEHYVLRDELRALQTVLAERGLLDAGALDAVSAAGASPAQKEDAAAFAESLLRPLLGVQQASGATGRFSLANRRRT